MAERVRVRAKGRRGFHYGVAYRQCQVQGWVQGWMQRYVQKWQTGAVGQPTATLRVCDCQFCT